MRAGDGRDAKRSFALLCVFVGLWVGTGCAAERGAPASLTDSGSSVATAGAGQGEPEGRCDVVRRCVLQKLGGASEARVEELDDYFRACNGGSNPPLFQDVVMGLGTMDGGDPWLVHLDQNSRCSL